MAKPNNVVNFDSTKELLEDIVEVLRRNLTNMERVKRFYNDEDSFDELMVRIITKDYERLEKVLDDPPTLTPWRVFFVIMDIVQEEGEQIDPYDVLTRTTPSRSFEYMGWTFSCVHGENTLTSIYNREDELVYRF